VSLKMNGTTLAETTSFSYQDGQLYCEATPVADIVAAAGSPLYLYSRRIMAQQARAYQTAVAPAPALICYAVKANGNPALIRLLGDAGLGADVTSGGELFLAQHAGIPPDKIIFSGVGKSRPEIEMGLAAGIRALHVESEMELALIAQVAADLGRVADVAVRVNPNISAETHPYISTGQHAHKFGVPVERAVAMLRQAADHPWLHPVGLAAHIGSQITDLAPFVESAEFLVTTAQRLAEMGIRLTYLDVGGGLGIDYDDHGAPAVAEWATAVAAPVIRAGYQVVMEPGRSIVGPAGALVSRVLYTKQQGDRRFVITDAGMSELIRPTLYNAYHPIWPVVETAGRAEEAETVEVVGPICETGDWLARARPLPPLRPGDLLAFLQAGAYGFAMSSNYNGRLKTAEVLVDGSEFRLIRRRQRYEHLLDGCD
jgi:diaminopimelate decarboxylase